MRIYQSRKPDANGNYDYLCAAVDEYQHASGPYIPGFATAVQSNPGSLCSSELSSEYLREKYKRISSKIVPGTWKMIVLFQEFWNRSPLSDWREFINSKLG